MSCACHAVLVDMCACTPFTTIINNSDINWAIEHLKKGKRDQFNLDSTHFIVAAPVISDVLVTFFTTLIHHGFLPSQLVDCVLVPVPKTGEDLSQSDNYQPIALASSLSKILKWCILIQYASYLDSCNLQLGFKKNLSTTLCTGTLKQVVAKYIYNCSSVLLVFLDAFKVFDLVRHDILFQLLLSRGLPPLVVRLLYSWYHSENLRIRWSGSLSRPFAVSNGVWQGGVLSPILFAIYLDELLMKLKSTNVSCYWGYHFVGALAAYADEVLLAPSAAAYVSYLVLVSSLLMSAV